MRNQTLGTFLGFSILFASLSILFFYPRTAYAQAAWHKRVAVIDIQTPAGPITGHCCEPGSWTCEYSDCRPITIVIKKK